jgi:hypothetical protein
MLRVPLQPTALSTGTTAICTTSSFAHRILLKKLNDIAPELLQMRLVHAGTSAGRPSAPPAPLRRWHSHTPSPAGFAPTRQPPQQLRLQPEPLIGESGARPLRHLPPCRVIQSSIDYDGPQPSDFSPQRRRFVWAKLASPWHLRPQFQDNTQALHDEIVRRSQFTVQLGALYTLLRVAAAHEDAKLCFSALESVRLSLVQRQQLKPFSPELLQRLAQMVVRCDALDVLLEAMPRTVELGITLSLSSLHYLMAEYGNALKVDQLAELMQMLEQGGIRPSVQTYYIVVRACVNAGRLEAAERYALECRAQGLHLRPSVLRLLQAAGVELPVEQEELAEELAAGDGGAAGQVAAGAGDAALNAAAAAAAVEGGER